MIKPVSETIGTVTHVFRLEPVLINYVKIIAGLAMGKMSIGTCHSSFIVHIRSLTCALRRSEPWASSESRVSAKKPSIKSKKSLSLMQWSNGKVDPAPLRERKTRQRRSFQTDFSSLRLADLIVWTSTIAEYKETRILEIPGRHAFVAGETLFRQNNVGPSSEHDFAWIPCEDETKTDEDSRTIVF
jgi:hypothetical protein